MKKTGIIKSLNVSPKGFYEGLLLVVREHVIQVNFPKELTHAFGDAFMPQKEVSLEVEPEDARGTPEHKVFRLVRAPVENGGVARNRTGRHRFSGKVERLNYALHGEVNGGILDSGDFLHLKPEGAAAVGIEPGMAVKGVGEMKPMIGGCSVVIEAEEVNGIAIENHKAKKKHAG